MAYLYRLIAMLALMLPMLAEAQTGQQVIKRPGSTTTEYCGSYNTSSNNQCGPTGANWASPHAAAGAKLAAWATSVGGVCGNGTKPTVSLVSSSASGGVLYFPPCPGGVGYNQNYGNSTRVVNTQPQCPSASDPIVGTEQFCVCKDGYEPNGDKTECLSKCSDKAGTSGGGQTVSIGGTNTGSPSSACLGTTSGGTGCTITLDNLNLGWQDNGNLNWYYRFNTSTYSGQGCSIAAAPGAATPQVQSPPAPAGTSGPLPTGMCSGTVNGVTVVVACGTTVTPTKSTSSGTTTTADGGVKTDSTTTSGTTSCKDGVCTTTTSGTVTSVVTPAGGGTPTTTATPTTTTKTESQADFCKNNPTVAVCKSGTDGTFGGGCSAGFVCTGDAVLCEAAKGIREQKCALIDGGAGATASPEFGAYNAAKELGSKLGTTTVTVSSGSFDSSNALGVSATCITDKSVVVWGTTVVLPFAQVCPYLQILGTIMLSLSWLMAAVIVGKGVIA